MGKEKKKGLGVGLDALFGEELNAPGRAAMAVTELPVAKIEPRADQPRKTFDELALEELAESIRAHGLIQPITVRPQESGYYQIVAGERRWRAARKAGLETVPVHVVTADEQAAMEMALVENLQREDLNPIEEALGYQTLQDEYGMTQEAVAQTVGKSRPAVTNAMRLLALSEPVRRLVEEGTLSAGHARALLPLEDPDMQLKAAQTVLEKGYSVRRTEALAAAGVRATFLNHAENPMTVGELAKTIVRAREVGILTCVCADSIWARSCAVSFPCASMLSRTFSFFSWRLRRYLSLSSRVRSCSSSSVPVASFRYLAMKGIVFPSSMSFIAASTCQVCAFMSLAINAVISISNPFILHFATLHSITQINGISS